MATTKEYTVIDLFAGCGGLSLGLYQAGWTGLFAIEKNKFAFDTLKANLIDKKKHFKWPKWLSVMPHDVNDVLKNYQDQLIRLKDNVDLVAGGPPCQGFSMAGKREKEDVRNSLVFSYIKFIEFVMPKMILFENVKGFTYAFNKKDKGSISYSQKVIDQLTKLGYKVCPYIIDFSDYGIPQKRKRFILVGFRKDYFPKDEFINLLEEKKKDFLKNKGLTEKTTVKDAISDLLHKNGEMPTPDRKGFMSGKYGIINSNYQKLLRGDYSLNNKIPDSHSFARHSESKINCFKRLLKDNELKGKRIAGDSREKWGLKQRSITILNEDLAAPTITGHPDDYLHYSEPRIMTVRECARIQSFPDWYEIKDKYTTGGKLRREEVPRYSQVGNAVPPLFAELVGLVLKEMI